MEGQESELSTFYTVPIFTHGNQSPSVKVSASVHPGEEGILVENVLRKACLALGVKNENIGAFTLVEGRETHTRRYRPEDTLHVPLPETLFLKRWTFTADCEMSTIDDPGALHLLHAEAVADVNSGRILPSKQQREKLEEYSDVNFCLKNQYVLLCHQVALYWSVTIRGVTICKCAAADLNQNSFISTNSPLDLYICTHGFEIQQNGNRGWIPWQHIRSWTADRKVGNLHVEVMCENAAIWCLKLDMNEQLEYALSAISEVLKSQQTEDSLFYTSMIQHNKEDNRTSFQNALFAPRQVVNDDNYSNDSPSSDYQVPEGCVDLTKLELKPRGAEIL